MSVKITRDHLDRAAVVYVRQSTMSQVMGNLESQRRQYDLAQAAETAGFKSVAVIDDDLGRSGSGSTQRPDLSGLWRWFVRVTSVPFIALRRRGWRAMDATGIT